jgi:4-amino-4-deoxy-L-arabinose transferase-like glycosyltransferase
MAWRPLLCVAGLYLAIQACWLIALPPFEGPDELQHYDHIRYVAVNGHLPDKVPAQINEDGYFTGEWTQEGAYYWMLGLVLRQTCFQDERPVQTLGESPHSTRHGGTAASAFTHDAPLPPHVLNGLLLGRTASVLFGLGTLLCVFAAIAMCCGDDRIARLAASCVALVPQFGVQHILITNDTAAAMWASLASALVIRFLARTPNAAASSVQQGPNASSSVQRGTRRLPAWWLAGAIGLATGLAIATKLTAGVVLVAMPLALWARRERVAWRPHAIAWAAGLLLTAGVAFGRNWIVFGDPLATSLKRTLVTQFDFRSPFKPGEWTSYVDLVRMLFRGMWASIGWGGWMPDAPWILAVFGALTLFLLVCVGVALRLAIRAIMRGRVGTASTSTEDALVVMLIVLALHTAAFVVSISLVAGYSARYFLPMIVPCLVIAVIGAQWLLGAIRARFGVEAVRWTLAGVMLTLAAAWLGTFAATIVAFHFEDAL